ncbi:TonB-dependent receptor plug domain-containing protein [Thalassotalea marina]|uniref:TonB-dependent receptor n=1 Tax=Thalassotalea marina TaxID=1673741 RepID=A0A919EK47_9GAMM|nr:TonB-dependent receptor [Thalassotalea marina]GHF88895.1 TonB-dependent receptor [Thalassotalea marina]
MFNWFTTFVLLLLAIPSLAFADNQSEVDCIKHNRLLDFSLQQLIETKVTVASLSEETVAQAPVPVTVITEQMIKQSGALDLKELLLTYVPGFTDVEDQNEINIAARGIFTSAQQKILFLINGHRLNSRSYAMATPDPSISLDKIKQIEVLRGPASSLYGNVSLTATVNIVLKSANSSDSLVKATIGQFGQRGLSINYTLNETDKALLIWAATYKADGEIKTLQPQDTYNAVPSEENKVIVGGVRDKAPYDIGMSLETAQGSVLLNARASHYIEPFSAGGLSGETYKYNAFDRINGNSPGFGYQAVHANYQTPQLNLAQWSHEHAIYFDKHKVEAVIVIDPSLPSYGGPTWSEKSWGLLSKFSRRFGDSELLLGGQLEHYSVYGATFPIGIRSFRVNTVDSNLLPSGSESNYSLFAQYKKTLNEHWQANLGLRYDIKNRRVTDNLTQLSPRLGLVYQNQDTSVKLSYSEAFVDATYWNRFSNLASFKGAKTLKPEKLKTWQVSPTFNFPNHDLQLTTSFFYDQAIDVIFRDNSAMENNYSNAGRLETVGVEQELHYIQPQFNVRLNASYRHAKSSEKIAIDHGYINNVPKINANMILDYKVTDHLNVHIALRYVGKQYSPIDIQRDGNRVVDPFPRTGVDYFKPNNYQPALWLVNTNINIQLNEQLNLSVRADNLLNKEYQLGGSTLHPYPKKGRWLTAQLTYDF